MDNLPMNKKNNIFFRIKAFLKKVFWRETECNSTFDAKVITQRRDFQDDIKAIGKQNEVLRKMEEQHKRNNLLEKIAKNPELLDGLSMDELMKIENMYDEEISKLAKNNN